MLANHSILFFTVIIVIIVLIGTLSFHFVEWWGMFNAFYFTTVTMATVGYGDMAPITHAGKIVAIFYWFMGAPMFIGLTWIILQSKFQKVVKNSIHEYHKEIKEAQKEAEKLWEDIKKEQEIQQKIQEWPLGDIDSTLKQSRWKKIFKKKSRK